MGDKYQCRDCEEYFKAFVCCSCKELTKDRCYWCHFDYNNDVANGDREPDKDIVIKHAG